MGSPNVVLALTTIAGTAWAAKCIPRLRPVHGMSPLMRLLVFLVDGARLLTFGAVCCAGISAAESNMLAASMYLQGAVVFATVYVAMDWAGQLAMARRF